MTGTRREETEAATEGLGSAVRRVADVLAADHRVRDPSECDHVAAACEAGGFPPDTTTTISSNTPFLRWHYPDQVLRVGGALSRPLSPVVPELPVSLPPS